MRRTSFVLMIGALCLCFAAGTPVRSSCAADLALLVSESDLFLAHKAVRELSLTKPEVRVLSPEDLLNDPSASQQVSESKVVVVDVMISELTDYLLENVPISEKRVYALRTSGDDDRLKARGFLFDTNVKAYFDHLSLENVQNMIRRVIHAEFDPSMEYGPVKELPETGVYHPAAKEPFKDFPSYLRWYETRPGYSATRPWIGVMLYSSSLVEGQSHRVRSLVEKLEAGGWNVLAAYGKDIPVIEEIMLDAKERPRVDILLAFSLKFHSALEPSLLTALRGLDVPVISAVQLYLGTLDEWRNSPMGIEPTEVVWTMTNPEVSGLIEPSVLGGKVKVKDPDTGRYFFVHRLVEDNLALLLPRLNKWVALRKKPNTDKRVAVIYYNHSRGKQNIGASYLNVFGSLEVILASMNARSYRFRERRDLTRETIRELVLKYGRNIGSWAPGELEEMLQTGKVVRLPVKTYREWYAALPAAFRSRVEAQWGTPESSEIMKADGDLILPMVDLGNVVILPEPARGWEDDPMKLYHSSTLYPHHQYIAAYLWLKHAFHADAMIHLGTHATHEWLPGKQAGLTTDCPPEVLITDIPNIYPYIVDDVGEGIQAKRRGRGVIIDHLTPALKKAGLYGEYANLYEMIGRFNRLEAQGASTSEAELREIKRLIGRLGLDRDVGISLSDENTVELLTTVEHYLGKLQSDSMPYGLHTFGRSPEGEALEETTKSIIESNPESKSAEVRKRLEDSGPLEIQRLLHALEGGYIPPGEGNDPVRNPEAVPTGKNFFGFDPAKIPSQAAYELGRQAAEDIISSSLLKKGRYPEKAAVVLFATETIRNEGINESTILHLLGLRPIWSRVGRVTGIEVIPGRELKRPRIDVVVNPSGLYRDLFPQLVLFLDEAIRKALVQTDIENLLRRNSDSIKEQLVAQGLTEEEAQRLSQIRIFSEAPGGYGTGVSEMSGASGTWTSNDEIAAVYRNRVGFAFGSGSWGVKAEDLFRRNLKGVDVAVHSISSGIYGTMDNDDLFQYLGGLSLAVEKERGEAPDTLITLQRTPDEVVVEDAARTVGEELRARYLNPKWIEGMKKEDYAGAREMSQFLENMWGWQVTVSSSVDEARWQQTYEVYIEDKYDMNLKEFFNQVNPWAYQSMTARMLESTRHEYWKAKEEIKRKLALEYAGNVVEKGVACCDHTCNNPLMNQMVVNLLSVPGLVSPEFLEKFKLAVEKAAGKELSEQVKTRVKVQQELLAGLRKKASAEDSKTTGDPVEKRPEAKPVKGDQAEQVEGFKMEKINSEEDTSKPTSSGVQWFASLLVLAMIALFASGVMRKQR